MTKYGEFFHCNVCGHVVCIVNEGSPTLVCCGQSMSLLVAQTSGEKAPVHLPVVVPNGENTIIKIGSEPHPMTSEHFISFIEVVTKDGKTCRAKLTDKPEAAFNIKAEDITTVFEYCNLHGLWMLER